MTGSLSLPLRSMVLASKLTAGSEVALGERVVLDGTQITDLTSHRVLLSPKA